MANIKYRVKLQYAEVEVQYRFRHRRQTQPHRISQHRHSRLLVYYFIVVHQSAEPGREADVAHGGTDRPTPPIPAKPMAQERTTLSTISRPSPKTKQNQRLLLPPKSCQRKLPSNQSNALDARPCARMCGTSNHVC